MVHSCDNLASRLTLGEPSGASDCMNHVASSSVDRMTSTSATRPQVILIRQSGAVSLPLGSNSGGSTNSTTALMASAAACSSTLGACGFTASEATNPVSYGRRARLAETASRCAPR